METADDYLNLLPEDYAEIIGPMLTHPPGTPGYETYYPLTACEMPQRASTDDKDYQKRRLASAWGKYAEALTARQLAMEGYTVREIDWHPPTGKGEIDIIAQKESTLVFVEVKARRGKDDDPWLAITPAKRKTICRGANIYLKQQPYTFDFRFDIALLRGDHNNLMFEYIPDAFFPPLTAR